MNYKLLKNRSFFLLMQGSLVSQIGSMMQTFALSLYVLNQYDSPTLFVSILIVSVIPRILIGPFAGVLVDWLDRKKIIVYLDLLSGIIVGVMAILYYMLGELPLWSIYSVSIVLSLIATLFNPAINTVIPTIMKEDELVDANAINSIVVTVSNLLAPLLGGVFMSFSVIGVVLVLNSVSFLLSAFTEAFIEIPKKHKKPDKITMLVFKNDFLEGLNFVKQSKFVFMIAVLACTLNFAISPVFSVAMPFILKKVMLIKDYEFGLLNAIVATASLFAGMVAPRIIKKLSTGRILIIDFAAQPIIVAVLTIITSAFVLALNESYLIILIAIAFAQYLLVIVMTIGNIVIGTTFQKEIPNALLGRVSTVIGTFAVGAVPLGQGIYGFMLDKFEPFIPMTCSVLLLLVIVIKAYPVLVAADHINGEKRKEKVLV